MATLGIDYGSSYTTVSWINPRYCRPEVIKFNGDGSVKYPSVILGYEDGIVTGFQALSYLEEVDKLPIEDRFEMLANFIPSLKRILDPSGIELLGDKEYSHSQLLNFFLKQIKQLAIAHCGSEVEFDSVVFSHPVDYNEASIDMIKQSFLDCGFKSVKTKLEPVAAVIGYGIEHDIPEGYGILVFDFGGGTTDVAYVKKQNGSYKILCEPKGDQHCGGQDIDMLIYEDLRKKILAKFGHDITKDNLIDYGMLNSCRRLKEYFSDTNDFHETSIIFFNCGQLVSYKYRLNRESFNNIIGKKIVDAINVAKAVNSQLSKKSYTVDKVLLIGGSSQITLVRQMLEEVFPEAPIDTCGEKDIAVALGNVAEESSLNIQSSVSEETSKDVSSVKIDINRAITCPSCESKKCYHHLDKPGYYCTTCGYDGPNVKVTRKRY